LNHSRILPEEALNKSQASKFTAMLLIGRNVGLAVSFFRSNSPPDLLFFLLHPPGFLQTVIAFQTCHCNSIEM
jgi:hypothetical protein